MEKTQITPNPGSEAAIAQGCKCPVLNNAHGRGRHGGKFWINLDCPIHVYTSREKDLSVEGMTTLGDWCEMPETKSEQIISALKNILYYDEGIDDICDWVPAELAVRKILGEED